jgi:hypothetical protein
MAIPVLEKIPLVEKEILRVKRKKVTLKISRGLIKAVTVKVGTLAVVPTRSPQARREVARIPLLPTRRRHLPRQRNPKIGLTSRRKMVTRTPQVLEVRTPEAVLATMLRRRTPERLVKEAETRGMERRVAVGIVTPGVAMVVIDLVVPETVITAPMEADLGATGRRVSQIIPRRPLTSI